MDGLTSSETSLSSKVRERLLLTIAAAVFLLFFQTFMIAPLIPSLADSFKTSQQIVALLVPAYTIPYAFAALVCGTLGDRIGRRGILYFSLAAFAMVSLTMAAAPGIGWLLALRVVSGMTNVGVIVMGLSIISDVYPAAERGRAIGWVFGAVAGGSAFGSTLGGLLAPLIGWRGLFIGVGAVGALLLLLALPARRALKSLNEAKSRTSLGDAFKGFGKLLSLPRGRRTYGFIFGNAVFHSGVFTWLGVILHNRFGLGEVGIGLALTGFGVPGLVLGPSIGKLVDRHGRHAFIPLGLLTAAVSAALLAPRWPLAVDVIAITLLSLGFDMSHPLFAGIVSTLDDQRRGQAMGLNTFSIFLGFGCGSLIFGGLLHLSVGVALGTFAMVQFGLSVLAVPAFQEE